MAENGRGLSYAEAGVDIDAGNRTGELIKRLVRVAWSGRRDLTW
jgi:phosphoribosylaminoimidazole (AIR) synthetase